MAGNSPAHGLSLFTGCQCWIGLLECLHNWPRVRRLFPVNEKLLSKKMSEAIEIRTIINNRNLNNVTDTPVTDPASGAKVIFIQLMFVIIFIGQLNVMDYLNIALTTSVTFTDSNS
nr:unnamed protein product [Callosobruchus analis]